MKKIIMYLSAFLPMFWIMLIKDYLTLLVNAIENTGKYCDLLNIYLFIALGFTLLITVVFTIMMAQNKKLSYETVIVKAFKNRTAEYYLGYFSLFVLALLCFTLTGLVDIIVLALILTVLGKVYIKNNLYFINPTINIIKGFIYEVEYSDGRINRTRIVVSKSKIRIDETLLLEASEYEFTFAREAETESENTTTKKEGN